MSKTAFIFPGQGAQYIGMGKDFFDNIPVCRDVYEDASKASGLNVKALCFEENDQLNITEYTQIAMVATEIAIYRALEEKGIKPDVTAGLSLGEYSALVVSGAMSQEDVFALVRKRGIYMQQAVPVGGAMVAVLGLDTAIIEEVCNEQKGILSIANYNCPGQIVITGEEKAAKESIEKLMEKGAKRCIPLNVSGPFHSPLLKEAGIKLGEEMKTIEVSEIAIPYLSNVTGDFVTSKDQIKDLLQKQVASSVKWQQSIEKMIEDGVTTFVEVGPGKTLSGFMKKINKEVTVLNIDKYEDFEKVVEVLV